MKNPKFKVGDTVRILDVDAIRILGLRLGTISEVGKRRRQYLVKPTGPGMWHWWIKEKDLEPVEQPPC